MKVLSLDQARNMGFAIFNDGKLIKYGTETIAPKNVTYEIMLPIAKEFTKNLLRKNKIDFIFIEDIQQQANVQVYSKLSMLLGVLICLFEELKIPYKKVPSTTWKSFCRIKKRKREEEKLEAIEFVKSKYNIDVESDTADAICIGYYGVNNLLKGDKNGK